jgi:hypothetical protein
MQGCARRLPREGGDGAALCAVCKLVGSVSRRARRAFVAVSSVGKDDDGLIVDGWWTDGGRMWTDGGWMFDG